jgi:hypothetical protein
MATFDRAILAQAERGSFNSCPDWSLSDRRLGVLGPDEEGATQIGTLWKGFLRRRRLPEFHLPSAGATASRACKAGARIAADAHTRVEP